jgi:hypothetical protein
MIRAFLKRSVPFIPLLLLAGCSDRYDTIVEQAVSVKEARHMSDTMMKDSVQGFYFSRLNKPASFGLGCDVRIPEQNQNKQLFLVTYGRARSNYAQSGGIIVAAAHYNDVQVSWMVLPIKIHITDTNTWCYFRDSVRLDNKIDGKSYNHINVMTHLPYSTTEKFDIDTLHVLLKQKHE